jgi:hypothetical protein
MKKFLVLLTMCLWASSSFALLDDGVNSLGAYFDVNGDVNCFAPTPATPFNVYWILANPAVANLGGFEFAWAFSPEVVPAPFILGATLPASALNIGTNFNLIVGLGGGLVTTDATTLVTLNMMVLAPVAAATYITAGPATPASIPGHAATNDFTNPAAIIPMNFSTVDGVNVIINEAGWVVPGVAKMSCPGPVATETATWSNVKTLFR